MMTVGSSNTSLHDIRLVALGASPATDLEGFVQIMEANVSSHELNGASTNNIQLIPADIGAVEYQFGTALAVGNINDCRKVGPWDYACGQELLVGAPDTGTGSTGGGVYLYEPNNDPAVEPILVPAGSITDPNFVFGSEFGASIAIASRERAESDAPWETSELEPRWVAVGAPGDERVEIYWVNPGAAGSSGASPFTHAMTLTNPNPSGSTGFGSVVVAENVSNDGDKLPELIVSAPNGPNGGAVWVYEGLLSGPQAVNPVGLQVSRSGDTSLPGAPTMQDSFGAAVAAGPILFDGGNPIVDQRRRNGLLVGLPSYEALDSTGTAHADAGAVCQFELGLDGGSPSHLKVVSNRCEDRLPLSSPIAGARTGASLAVGNFLASDKNGVYYSDASLLSDIAVGSPGMNSDQGVVWVMAAQQHGLDFLEITTFMADPFGSPGDEYGETLSSGYIGESLWGDLVLGQPAIEAGSLTRATAVNSSSIGACTDLTGWWEVETQYWDEDLLSFESKTSEIVIWEETGDVVVVFQKPLFLNVSETGATTPCEMDLLDGSHGNLACDESLALLVAGTEENPGVDQYQYASNTVAKGTVINLGSTCASALDSSTGAYTWTGVPLGSVIEEGIDDELWLALGGTEQANLQGITATVTIVPGTGSTASLDIDIPWTTDVWPNIATIGGCSFDFGTSCSVPSPLPTGSPEYPADATRTKESVCED